MVVSFLEAFNALVALVALVLALQVYRRIRFGALGRTWVYLSLGLIAFSLVEVLHLGFEQGWFGEGGAAEILEDLLELGALIGFLTGFALQLKALQGAPPPPEA